MAKRFEIRKAKRMQAGRELIIHAGPSTPQNRTFREDVDHNEAPHEHQVVQQSNLTIVSQVNPIKHSASPQIDLQLDASNVEH